MIRYTAIPEADKTAKTARLAKARKALAETEIQPAPRKRERPAKPETEKPWVAAGLSRASYYRKAKAETA